LSLRDVVESNTKHLSHMITTNEKYLHVKSKQEEFERLTRNNRKHLNSVKILETIINNSRASYSQSVIDSITASLSNCLDIILQDKEYDIDLEVYPSRGNNHLRAWLIDEDGIKLPPSIVEGDMLNQVLSFCASVILTKLRGYSWIYYDEAFASANSRSVIMIRRLIKTFMEEGFNFVFVGQNPLLFTEFDRNLIELIQEAGCVSDIIQTFIPASNDATLDERALELHDNLLRG